MLSKGVIEKVSHTLDGSTNGAPAHLLSEASSFLLREIGSSPCSSSGSRISASLSNRLQNSSDAAALGVTPNEACSIGLTAWADAQWARCVTLSKSQECKSVFLDILLLYQGHVLATRPHHVSTLANRHVAASRPLRTTTRNIKNRAIASLWARESVLLGAHAPTSIGGNITSIRGHLYSFTYLLGLLRDPVRWNACKDVDVYRRVTLLSPQWSAPRTAVDVAGGLDYGAANRGELGPKFRARLSPYVLSNEWSDEEVDALSTILLNDDD
ncbi:Hypothetical protein, putative [Bodo saltans]|uniref:Uncharacterized protein n=1 Tax=Bodo saltans TaxID=75058 RepID=A0A0S4JRU6_BODSA|nr:Hypothetical protein, putative [Bodo saltans]|eukprot:CUG93076.1 Hypothetical protein, putative [Bodo saltans]